MNISSETKVGITVLLAAIVAVVGFRFMSDVPILSQSLKVQTTFVRADGLGTGSQVFVKGVKVGSVSQVQLTPSDSVRVIMRLDMNRPLPKGTVAYLTSLGLIEGKSIVLELGSSDEYVEFGGTIEGRYVQSIMETLGSKGQELGDDLTSTFTELNTFLEQLNETLDEDTQSSLNETLKNTSSATRRIASMLEKKQQDIDQAITSGSSMLAQLDTLATDSRPRVDTLIASLEKNIRELENVRVELEGASAELNEILKKINSGEGTIGKMVNDPSLYDNLDELTNELNVLMKGINEDPGRYLKHMKIIELF
ncbi:MlaD family protein [Rhodohalobacter sp. 8-1]|uniref:MlaD family protein n=1 Tax=Rhodohalobacter sp. 8-1 TaxID=3131972 RepID=UPI0030ECFAD2